MSKNRSQFTIKQIIEFKGKSILVFRGIIIFFGDQQDFGFPKVGELIDFELEEPQRKVETRIEKIEGNIVYIKQV